MEQFMLIYKGGDADWLSKASQQEIAASKAEWQSWSARLEVNGQLVSLGAPLDFSGAEVKKQGEIGDLSSRSVADLVTGYSFINADSLDEAIAWAKQSPYLRYPQASVEVRRVTQMTSKESSA